MYLLFCLVAAGAPATAEAGAPFGALPLVCEIDCAAEPGVPYAQYPEGVSRVATFAGRPCRLLPNDSEHPKYMAWRVGQGLGLKAGAAYVLAVDFPDDAPRSMFILNWGCETARGVHTGATTGDVLKGRYVNQNPESLQVPQSGGYLTWRQYFRLHDRFPDLQRPRGQAERPFTPEDGFWVIIAQAARRSDPLSEGAAVARIRLYEVPDPAALKQEIHYPPDGLPRRHLFWREEMSDAVIAMGHRPEEKDPKLRGVADPIDWYRYKAELAEFLGMNTFCKDLLEFGHNQGWDSGPYGGNAWYNQSPTPDLWDRILAMMAEYPGLSVLPYYEYAGSIGQDPAVALGSQRRCVRLDGGKDYTHIPWVHSTNADLADPVTLEDAEKLLDATITRFRDRVHFLGAWFRPRPEANPISFNETDLALFAAEANGGRAVSREGLKADEALLASYYEWWYAQRRDFLVGLRDYLRSEVDPAAMVLYTCDSSEPGTNIPSELAGAGQRNAWEWKTSVVCDQVERWAGLLQGDYYQYIKAVPYTAAVEGDWHHRAQVMPRGTWGEWEWQHACPTNDPANYRQTDGVMLTYTINKLYTVDSDEGFEAFRTPGGLAVVRHYALNENEMYEDGGADVLGYFVADVERAGPYCMLAEARALAHGDPRYLGYLAGNSFSRGFPEYVRAFDAAFLSLPAVPSEKLPGACDDAEVVVRRYPTERDGTWYAVINTGYGSKQATVRLGAADLEDATTGQPADLAGPLALYPGQVRTFHARR